MKTNVMIDIETLSTNSNALILSIGACEFSEKNGIGVTFYNTIDIESSLHNGFKIDGKTIEWWLKQSNEAKKDLFDNRRFTIKQVLISFSDWLNFYFDAKNINIWGNGSDFDNAILKNAYDRMKISIPWDYRNNRCFRTLKSLFPNVEKPETNNHHNALGDALWQAKYAINIWEEYEIKAGSGEMIFPSFFE